MEISVEYNSDFKKDLEFGKEAENLTVKILKQRWPKTKRVTGYHKEWDIEIPEIDMTIEAKYDKQTEGPDRKTGNLFIECESRGEPSGIETSKADYWFYWYCSLRKLVRIPTSLLKETIRKNNFRKVNGGDSNSSKGYLVPVKLFEKENK